MHIARDDVVRGRLVCSGTVLLEGVLEGDVACARLEVGADGRLLGNVAADEVIVDGEIIGNARARRIWLRSGALVEGNLWHAALIVDPRAVLVGDSHREPAAAVPSGVAELRARQATQEAELVQLEQASRLRQSLAARR